MTRRKIIWLIGGGFAAITAGIASLVALPASQVCIPDECTAREARKDGGRLTPLKALD